LFWPRGLTTTQPTGTGLVAFEGAAASARDTALAYAIAAERQRADRDHSRALLESVNRESPTIRKSWCLADIYRNAGQAERAIRFTAGLSNWIPPTWPRR
jgi:hypothetical protein